MLYNNFWPHPLFLPLAQLHHGPKANVMGLIEACDPPAPSKADNTVFSCYFELVDESNTKLVCTMSEGDVPYLPHSPCYRDVLCLRRVIVERSEARLVARPSTNTTWLLFKKEDDYKPTSSFTNLTVGITENGRLSELKAWALRNGEPLAALWKLSEYYVILCVCGLR